MKVFVDTGPLRALVDTTDQFRQQTVEKAQKFSEQHIQFITTDYVIAEVFTGLLGIGRSRYYRIKDFNKRILKNKVADIEWITQERFFQTKSLFLKVSKDKFWSFTDCASYVVMKELKINTTFTFDEHFTQMGFTLL